MTVLDMTQNILSEMDGDNVNTIDGTTESLQVANIIQQTFYSITDNRDWAYQTKVKSLNDDAVDVLTPTLVTIGNNIKEIKWLKYDTSDSGTPTGGYKELHYLTPEEFILKTSGRNLQNDNVVESVINEFATIRLVNNANPTYFTTLGENQIILDSWNSEDSTTIVSRKILTEMVVASDFELTDDFIPPIPTEAFSLLLNKAKATCFFALKQMNHPYADREALKQSRWLSRNNGVIGKGVKYPDYGRKGNRLARPMRTR